MTTDLGHIVFWTVKRQYIDPDAALASLDAAGFSGDILPRVPRDATVLREACYRAVTGRRDIVDIRIDFKRVHDDDDTCEFGLIRYEVENKRARGVQCARLVLDKSTGKVTTDNPFASEARAALAFYNEGRGKYTDDVVREVIVRFLRSSRAFALRPTGGFYFVHDQYRSALERMKGWIDQYGELYAGPMRLDGNSMALASRAASDDLTRRFNELAEQVNSFGDTTRVSTMKARLAEFQALRDDLLFYRGAFAVRVDDIDAQIVDLETKVEQIITGRVAE